MGRLDRGCNVVALKVGRSVDSFGLDWVGLGWSGGGIGIDDGLKWSGVVRKCEGIEKNMSIWI